MFVLLIFNVENGVDLHDIVGPFDHGRDALKWALEQEIENERFEVRELASPNIARGEYK